MIDRLVPLLALVLLAGCGDGDAARVSINADGNASAPGSLKVRDSKGFKANVEIPGLASIAGDMDIEGVKPFPKSSFAGINIDAADKRDEKVALTFVAPADRAQVAAWYAKQFADNGFTARPTPGGFAGTTKDGDAFTLDFSDEGGRTRGEFKLGKTAS